MKAAPRSAHRWLTGVLHASVVQWCALLFLLSSQHSVVAQPVPQPDLLFVVVEDERGRPMRGAFAEDASTKHLYQRSGVRHLSVSVRFTLSAAHPYGPERPGDKVYWTRNGTPLRAGLRTHRSFTFIDCWCTDVVMEVVRGEERMLIDLPHDPAERWAVLRPMWSRSTKYATPEVFVFRPGRFTYAELANDPACDRLEERLARRHATDADQQYRDAQWQRQMQALEAYFGANTN
jgi:hypothetical protein